MSKDVKSKTCRLPSLEEIKFTHLRSLFDEVSVLS